MVWAAGNYTVFDDEAFSCRRYVLPLGEMVSALWHGVEPDPPFYYILLNLWIKVFGVAPLALRGLSILLFLAGLWFLKGAAAVWFDKQVARLAFILAAIHPAHLFFGFAARWYSAMFLAVSILLWLTGRIARSKEVSRGAVIGWSFAAAVVCYTNYFGPVVVGLCALAGFFEHRAAKVWLPALAGAVVLFAPWTPPFIHQLTAFPQLGGGLFSLAGTAGRTGMALCAGNLAAPGSWWVWIPMAFAGFALAARLLTQRTALRPFLLLVGGCLFAGIITRTMIDKYILCISGPACILIAAAWARGSGSSINATNARVRSVGIVALVIAWLGCGINLMTERHWSSLRWLDPFTQVIQDAAEDPAAPHPRDWVMTHPSARYYFALDTMSANGSTRVYSPAQWRTLASEPERTDAPVPATPRSMLDRMRKSPPREILVLRTAGFSDDSDWQELDRKLASDYELILTKSYLPDPDAVLKDKLDPRYKHPRDRIQLEIWSIATAQH